MAGEESQLLFKRTGQRTTASLIPHHKCVRELVQEDTPLFLRTRHVLSRKHNTSTCRNQSKTPNELISSDTIVYSIYLMTTYYTHLVATVHTCPHRQIHVSLNQTSPLTHPSVANLSE